MVDCLCAAACPREKSEHSLGSAQRPQAQGEQGFLPEAFSALSRWGLGNAFWKVNYKLEGYSELGRLVVLRACTRVIRSRGEISTPCRVWWVPKQILLSHSKLVYAFLYSWVHCTHLKLLMLLLPSRITNTL